MQQGAILKPPETTSKFDFLGLLGLRGGSGNSGADAELGPGLYVTDDMTTYVQALSSDSWPIHGVEIFQCNQFRSSEC